MSSPSSLSSALSSASSSRAVAPVLQKRPASTFSSPVASPVLQAQTHLPPEEVHSDVSSDTSGSVPGSPGGEDDDTAEQVTFCRWDGCERDLGNMDELVKHIHDEHIGTRKQTYACMWDDCNRKGLAHASGYALRAHMRSHTKEKPFYCTLPGRSPPLPLHCGLWVTGGGIHGVVWGGVM